MYQPPAKIRSVFAKIIESQNNTISTRDIKIDQSPFFPNRIPAHPPSEIRVVLAHLVFAEASHGTPGLRAEAVREGGSERAGGDKGFAEGAVVVVRGDHAVGDGKIFRYVAFGIISRDVGLAVADDGKEAADTAGALESAVEIEAPEVVGDVGHET